jgi:hypothetical protein
MISQQLQGWARDLSDSGLGAFVAENLVIGELVTLQISIGFYGKRSNSCNGVSDRLERNTDSNLQH